MFWHYALTSLFQNMETETIEIFYICRNCGYRDSGDIPIEDGVHLKQTPRCNRCGNGMVERKENE